MNNGRIAVAAAAAMGLTAVASAGDAAMYGYGGEFAIRALDVKVAPKVLDQWWGQLAAGGWFDNQPDGTARFEIKQWGNTVVEGSVAFALADGKVRSSWRFEAKRDFTGHGVILDIQLPIEKYAGGTFTGDGKATALPWSSRKASASPAAGSGRWSSATAPPAGRLYGATLLRVLLVTGILTPTAIWMPFVQNTKTINRNEYVKPSSLFLWRYSRGCYRPDHKLFHSDMHRRCV